jgi:hypothetical protein
MSRQATLEQLRDALLTIDGLPVFHYFKPSEVKDRYCIWAEDTEATSLQADNIKSIQQLQGTIDLYSKQEFDPAVDAIQEALNASQIGFYQNSIQYEDETGLIHWEWVFYLI